MKPPEAAKLWLVLDSQLGVGVKKTFLFWADDVWVPFKGGECEKTVNVLLKITDPKINEKKRGGVGWTKKHRRERERERERKNEIENK